MKRWNHEFHLETMLGQERELQVGAAESCPQEIRDWLARLKLLNGLPLSYLVGDEKQLPPESIRFFYVDQNWTDQLINGAFSVGAASEKTGLLNSFFRFSLQKGAGEDLYRCREKRIHANQRKFCKRRSSNSAGEILTGFLLRSRLVRLWRGLESTATDEDGNPLDILRMEQLSEEILICIYNGEIHRLSVGEPGEGLRFGAQGDDRIIRVRDIREGNEGRPLIGKETTICADEFGKADILGLADALKKELGVDAITSAEMAMELIIAPGLAEFERPGKREK